LFFVKYFIVDRNGHRVWVCEERVNQAVACVPKQRELNLAKLIKVCICRQIFVCNVENNWLNYCIYSASLVDRAQTTDYSGRVNTSL